MIGRLGTWHDAYGTTRWFGSHANLKSSVMTLKLCRVGFTCRTNSMLFKCILYVHTMASAPRCRVDYIMKSPTLCQSWQGGLCWYASKLIILKWEIHGYKLLALLETGRYQCACPQTIQKELLYGGNPIPKTPYTNMTKSWRHEYGKQTRPKKT